MRLLVVETCIFLNKHLLYTIGGERSTRNQTTAHRSVDGCAPSRDAQSHCTDRALQRRVNYGHFRIIVPCTTFYYVNLLLKKNLIVRGGAASVASVVNHNSLDERSMGQECMRHDSWQRT